MPVLVRYCNKCGIRISPLELEMNKAVKHGGVYYCAKCAEELVIVAEVVEERHKKSDRKRISAPGRRYAAPSDRERVPPRYVHRERPLRVEEAGRQEIPRRSGSLVLVFLIIAAIVVVSIIVGLVVLNRRPRGTPAPDTDVSTPEKPEEKPPVKEPDVVEPGKAEDALRAEFNAIVKCPVDDPKQLGEVIHKLNDFVRKPDLPMSVSLDARKKIRSYESNLKQLAKSGLKKLLLATDTLVKEGKFQEAIEKLNSFPAAFDRFVGNEIDKDLQRVYREQGGDEKYLELVRISDDALKQGNPELAGKKVREWIKDFQGTVHEGEVRKLLASIEEKIEKQKQEYGKVRKEFDEAMKLARVQAENESYKEAAHLLKDFADKHPNEKELVRKAQDAIKRYEDLAEKLAQEQARKIEGARFFVDFTKDSPVSNMKYKYENAVPKALEDGTHCLYMVAPEASVVVVEFELEEKPSKFVLVIEHAEGKPPTGRFWKADIVILVNSQKIPTNYKLHRKFNTDVFKIHGFVQKGNNTIKIGLTKKSKSPYLLKRLAVAKSADEAFPAPKKPDGKEDGTTPDEGVQEKHLFDGKTLDGWKDTGPAKWSVQEGSIMGVHTGGEKPGYLYPVVEQSEKWFNYKLSFEVNCDVAGGWQVGLRTRTELGGIVSSNLLDASKEFVADKWYKITLRLEGKNIYTSVDGSEERLLEQDEKLLPGAFAFGVKPGAVAHIKNVTFKLISTK